MIKNRQEDDCTLDRVLGDNKKILELAKTNNVNYILIDNEYKMDIDL